MSLSTILSYSVCGTIIFLFIGYLILSFFRKPSGDYLDDNPHTIYLDNTGDVFYNLDCDEEELNRAIETIHTQLKQWMEEEISYTADIYRSMETIQATIAFKLNNIDIKLIPYNQGLIELENILTDNELTQNVSRLMNVFVSINMRLSCDIREALKGRFIYSMCYELPMEINQVPLPSKQQWLNALNKYPWLPYLVFLQEIYRTDSEYNNTLHKVINDNRIATAIVN